MTKRWLKREQRWERKFAGVDLSAPDMRQFGKQLKELRLPRRYDLEAITLAIKVELRRRDRTKK